MARDAVGLASLMRGRAIAAEDDAPLGAKVGSVSVSSTVFYVSAPPFPANLVPANLACKVRISNGLC